MSLARRRFRFIKEIAEGGFGKVYLAEQLSSDGFSRIVACKLLHAKWSSHDEVVMRTRDEARLLGLIRHQNIVKVEDLTSIDGKCAIIMEYLEGVDLKWMLQYLQEKNLEFPRAALFEIMLLGGSALDAAYNGIPLQGGDPLRVIHRDIKPSNIFVTVAGQVKVLDFGTARANFAEREAKTQALAFGSQGYMAPERMLGEEDTPAADIFSLGVTLYELLCLDSFGRVPPRPNKFKTKIEEKIVALQLDGDPEWQDQVRETLRLMLSYEPKDRPTAAQLVDIFELLANSSTDMGLRRFCRTLVAEAKANEPDLESGDPLTGKVVDEDVSSAFGMGAAGLQQLPSPPGPETSDAFGHEVAAPSPNPQADGFGGPPAAPPPSAPPHPSAAAAAGQYAITAQPGGYQESQSGEVTTGGGGSGLFLKLAIVGFVAFLIFAILGASGIGVGALIFYNSGEEGVDPVTTGDDTDAAVPVPVPEPAAAVPCSVTSPDSRDDVTKVAVTLTVAGSAEEITVSGGAGFKAEWDGQGECALGDLGPGKYRTNVVPTGGSKIRGKGFEVSGEKSCSFAFDVTAEEWTGGCE